MMEGVSIADVIEFSTPTIRIHLLQTSSVFLLDFENIPKWNYYVLKVRQLSDNPIGVGITYIKFARLMTKTFA